jgi:hypothetical protein
MTQDGGRLALDWELPPDQESKFTDGTQAASHERTDRFACGTDPTWYQQ